MISMNWVNADPADLDDVRELFREYQAELGIDLCFQGFEHELPGLPKPYDEPSGALLLVKISDRPVACGALKPLKSGGVELKRIYVRPEFRKMGLGREICCQLIEKAKQLGYTDAFLDTLDTLTTAIRLYESLGFVPTEPYNDSGGNRVKYFRLPLAASLEEIE